MPIYLAIGNFYFTMGDLFTYLLLIALVAGAVIWWRGKQRRSDDPQDVAELDDGFSIEPASDGSSTHFAINGSGIGGGAWFALVFAGLFFGALLALPFGSFNVFYTIMAIAIGIAFLWDRRRKQRFAFEVTKNDVKAPNGKRYAKADISELLIRNGNAIAHSVSTHNTTVIAGTGITGAAMMGATAMGNAASGVGNAIGQSLAGSLAKRGNQLSIRHGRKVVPLAKYLREDDAIALFNKVSEAL